MCSRLAMPAIMQALLDPSSPLAPMLGEGAMADGMARAFEGSLQQVGRAIKAGVPILAGSDAGNPVTFHGISLIRELELLAQAGMPLTDVLKAATSRAADRLGQSTLGRISAGAVADLVVLDADPTEDVSRVSPRRRRCILAAEGRMQSGSPSVPGTWSARCTLTTACSAPTRAEAAWAGSPLPG